MYFGGRVRFFHALVIEFALRKGKFTKKLQNIVRLTLTHAFKLGSMSFLHKLFVSILNYVEGSKVRFHHFIAGCLAGWIVFRDIKNVVNKQMILYFLARNAFALGNYL